MFIILFAINIAALDALEIIGSSNWISLRLHRPPSEQKDTWLVRKNSMSCDSDIPPSHAYTVVSSRTRPITVPALCDRLEVLGPALTDPLSPGRLTPIPPLANLPLPRNQLPWPPLYRRRNPKHPPTEPLARRLLHLSLTLNKLAIPTDPPPTQNEIK